MRFLYGIFLGALILAFASDPSWADSAEGKKLFKLKNCALCHRIELSGTEFKPICPGLKNVREKHKKEWLRKWLKNPAAVWKTNDKDVQDIKARYFKYRGAKPKPRESFMATIVGKTYVLTDDEIEALIDYLWTL